MKVRVHLTPKQQRDLKPLFDAVDEAAKNERGGGAILGQTWSADDGNGNSGCAVFHYLTPEQYKVVNRAIIRAMKIKE